MKDKLSIVITTCDKFCDLWENNLFLLKKFWNDAPSIFLISDKDNPLGKQLCTNFYYYVNDDYSIRLLNALKKVQTEYILLTLDDYLLCSTVNSDKINQIVEYMGDNDISYVRLFNRSKTKGWIDKKMQLHNLPLTKDAYEVNLYPSLWKKDALMKLITKNENIWKFEVRLTRRAREHKLRCAWVDNKRLFDFVDTIRKGKYLKKAYIFLKKNNLYISDRKIRTFSETFSLNLRTFVSRHTPDCLKRKLKARSKKQYFSEYAETDD